MSTAVANGMSSIANGIANGVHVTNGTANGTANGHTTNGDAKGGSSPEPVGEVPEDANEHCPVSGVLQR